MATVFKAPSFKLTFKWLTKGLGVIEISSKMKLSSIDNTSLFK